jgi:Tfp pilus assembly protein PilF
MVTRAIRSRFFEVPYRLLLSAVVLSLSLPGLQAQDPEAAHALVYEGIGQLKNGDAKRAMATYDRALALDSNNFMAMAEQANALFQLKRYEESVALCERVFAIHGAHEDISIVYIAAANSLDHAGKPEEALRMYRRGQERDPGQYQLHYNEGVTLARMERLDEALDSFKRSGELEPRHASTQNALARLEAIASNRIPALLATARFLIIEPEGPRAEGNLPMLKDLLAGDVEKTGKGKITIRLDGSKLPAEGDTTVRADDFHTVELMIALLGALDFEKKNRKRPEVELFEEKFDRLCGMLGEMRAGNHGYYWELYVPYFAELKEKGHVTAAVRVMHASAKDSKNDKWLKANKESIDAFYKWSSGYEWERKLR